MEAPSGPVVWALLAASGGWQLPKGREASCLLHARLGSRGACPGQGWDISQARDVPLEKEPGPRAEGPGENSLQDSWEGGQPHPGRRS